MMHAFQRPMAPHSCWLRSGSRRSPLLAARSGDSTGAAGASGGGGGAARAARVGTGAAGDDGRRGDGGRAATPARQEAPARREPLERRRPRGRPARRARRAPAPRPGRAPRARAGPAGPRARAGARSRAVEGRRARQATAGTAATAVDRRSGGRGRDAGAGGSTGAAGAAGRGRGWCGRHRRRRARRRRTGGAGTAGAGGSASVDAGGWDAPPLASMVTIHVAGDSTAAVFPGHRRDDARRLGGGAGSAVRQHGDGRRRRAVRAQLEELHRRGRVGDAGGEDQDRRLPVRRVRAQRREDRRSGALHRSRDHLPRQPADVHQRRARARRLPGAADVDLPAPVQRHHRDRRRTARTRPPCSRSARRPARRCSTWRSGPRTG